MMVLKDVQSSNGEGSFNSITVSLLTGIGLNYELNNKLCLIFEPIYKRDITEINNADVAYYYFYSFGANIGLRMRI